MYITGLSLLSMAGFALIAMVVAVRDVRTLSLPNGLTLALLVGYLLIAAAAGWSREEISASLITASMVLFVGLMLSAMGWLSEPANSNIAKFAAVCSLWLGAAQTLNFMALSILITACLGLLLVCLPQDARKRGSNTSLSAQPAQQAQMQGVNVPLAFAIAAAALLLIPQSPWATSVA